jgi:hypothetical protein
MNHPTPWHVTAFQKTVCLIYDANDELVLGSTWIPKDTAKRIVDAVNAQSQGEGRMNAEDYAQVEEMVRKARDEGVGIAIRQALKNTHDAETRLVKRIVDLKAKVDEKPDSIVDSYIDPLDEPGWWKDFVRIRKPAERNWGAWSERCRKEWIALGDAIKERARNEAIEESVDMAQRYLKEVTGTEMERCIVAELRDAIRSLKEKDE